MTTDQAYISEIKAKQVIPKPYQARFQSKSNGSREDKNAHRHGWRQRNLRITTMINDQ